MESIGFSNFTDGMDRRKGRTGRYDDAVWLMQNCYIDHGGVIRKRPGLKLIKSLPNNAFGLYSAFDKLHTFQNSGYLSEPEDSLIRHHTLAIPDEYGDPTGNDHFYQDSSVNKILGITSDHESIFASVEMYFPNQELTDQLELLTLQLKDYPEITDGIYASDDTVNYVPKKSGINEQTGLLYFVPQFQNGTLNSGEDTVFSNIVIDDDRVEEDAIFSPLDGDVGFQVRSKRIPDQNVSNKTRVATLFNRSFKSQGHSVAYTKYGTSADYQTPDAGWIPTNNYFQGDTTQAVAKLGRDYLVVFGESSLQIWKVDPNPANFFFAGLISGHGCTQPGSIQESSNTVKFLSRFALMELSISDKEKGQFDLNDISYKAEDIIKEFSGNSDFLNNFSWGFLSLHVFNGVAEIFDFTKNNNESEGGAASTGSFLTKNNNSYSVHTSIFMTTRFNGRIGLSENKDNVEQLNSFYFNVHDDGTITMPDDTVLPATYQAGDTIWIRADFKDFPPVGQGNTYFHLKIAVNNKIYDAVNVVVYPDSENRSAIDLEFWPKVKITSTVGGFTGPDMDYDPNSPPHYVVGRLIPAQTEDSELIGIGGNVTDNSYTRTSNSGDAGVKTEKDLILNSFFPDQPFSEFYLDFEVPDYVDAYISLSESKTVFNDIAGFIRLKLDGSIVDNLGNVSSSTYAPGDNIMFHIFYIDLVSFRLLQASIHINHLEKPIELFFEILNVPNSTVSYRPSIRVDNSGGKINDIRYLSPNFGDNQSANNDPNRQFSSIYLKEKNQYWVVDKDKAIVHYQSEVGKTEGISLYTFPEHIDYVAELNNELYFMIGSNLYQFDDDQFTDDGVIFDVRLETPFYDFDTPMDTKHVMGADIVIKGDAILEVVTDSNSQNIDYSFPVSGVTSTYGTLPVEAVTPSIALNIVNQDDQPFEFHGFNFYFDVMGAI